MKCLVAVVCAASCIAFPAAGAGESFNVLVFSKTLMFRHASITNGTAAIRKLGAENNFTVDATEDSGHFTPGNLAKYRVIVFLSTSGDVLNDEQQAAFQGWLRGGGGFVAVHAAVAGKVATEGTWPWYSKLFCTEFHNHPAIAPATIYVEDQRHPSTAHLPSQWVRTDEWYNFEASPRGKVKVLASLDETTYKGGTMGKDHPIAWWQTFEGGRVWYTALGHTAASYTEPFFLRHLLGGIQFAAGVWKPLWDGKTFDGWRIIGKGEWKIIDGAIRGTHKKEEQEFSHLVTDRTYCDFTVRLKYKAVKGNSGLYFRIEEKGFSGVSGFQAEIDAEKDVGGLYETNGRAWVSQPKPEDVKRYFKPGHWNEMTVSAHGGHIVVHVNGMKSAELKDDPGRREGKFALQVHGGQDCEVWFKDIEMLAE